VAQEAGAVEVIVGSQLSIRFEELSEGEWESLTRKLTFENDGDVVMCYRRLMTKGVYKLPRGAWNLLPNHIRYDDRRSLPESPKLKFTLKLDDTEKDPRFQGQMDAVKAMFEHEQGLIIRPPGTGKTQIALAFASLCQTKVLVLTHTGDIFNQWIEAAKKTLPDAKIGEIRGAKCVIGNVTIATVQTLNLRHINKPRAWWQQWGCVIVDEGHHVSAPTWEAVLNRCYAFYRFGFTASPTRADGMHPTMKFIIGPIIHQMKFSSTVDLSVEPLYTGFRSLYRGAWDWSNLLNKLVADENRNKKIAEVVNDEIARGNSVLVLSRRIEHLGNLSGLVQGPSEILTGVRSRRDRARILDEFRRGDIRCLFATQLADEALDVPRLNRVVLTFPGKHEGRIIQQVGRALRTHPGKTDAKIYDCIDDVGVLRHQWAQRRKTYNQNKIRVNSPIVRKVKSLWR
jgi:superfamily II DNA or RNA helicase